MKMRQKNITRNVKKQNEGITLIALVITIIVLLILAGVTIATLTGDNGLLSKASTTKNTVNEAEIAEKIRLAYQDYYLGQHTQTGYSFQDALDKIFGEGVAEATGPDSNGVYTVSVNGKIFEFNPATKELTPVSSSAAWTKNADGSYSVGEGSEKITINVGDYVNYDPTDGATTGLTYTSDAATNGDGEQIFNAETYKNAGYRWRVLDVKNGKIRLISEEYVGPGTYSDQSRTQYRLSEQAGYINGISELNKISAIFGHGKGAESATSITVDDINGVTGFNPNSPKYGQGNWDEYGNTITYTNNNGQITSSRTNTDNNDDKTYSWDGGTFYYYDSTAREFKELTSGNMQITHTAYYYNASSYAKAASTGKDTDGHNVLSKPYEILFGYKVVGDDNKFRTFSGSTQLDYWLASDCVHTSDWGANWGLRYVARRRRLRGLVPFRRHFERRWLWRASCSYSKI